MAVAKKRNPIKTLLWVLVLLVIATIMIMIFWPTKTDPLTGKTGRYIKPSGSGGSGPGSSASPSAMVVAPTTISDSDNPMTGPIE